MSELENVHILIFKYKKYAIFNNKVYMYKQYDSSSMEFVLNESCTNGVFSTENWAGGWRVFLHPQLWMGGGGVGLYPSAPYPVPMNAYVYMF